MTLDYKSFFVEDNFYQNNFYWQQLPRDLVKCKLNIKSDLFLAGLNFFKGAFDFLLENSELGLDVSQYEGKFYRAGEVIEFELPFAVALTGERVALNLLHHASSMATNTRSIVDKAEKYNIAVLDTRKTTPGLRALEKYAVRVGGGHNHRFSPTDMWMIKDNHKSFFGGIKGAIDFFKKMGVFYTPLIVEVHNLEELNEAIDLQVKHVMLDNFSVGQVQAAIKIKPHFMTYEISGGINLNNIENYLLPGVDAVSIGSIGAGKRVDISLKYKRK